MISTKALVLLMIATAVTAVGPMATAEDSPGTAREVPIAMTPAAEGSTVGADVADLQEQLEAGLRARRPREFAFLARVVQSVEQGRLPLKMVKETFQWARERHAYPYPYFERAIKIRAARIGVDL